MVNPQINKMEQILRDLLTEHEALLMLLQRKHEAIRQAKTTVVEDCTVRENAHVQRIGRLEKERQQLLAVMSPKSLGRFLRVAEIAEMADEPQRTHLVVLAAQLRQRMVEIKELSQMMKVALESLLKHMSGVVQMVLQTVGGGGTYGRRGRVTQAPKVSSFSAVA